MLFPTLEDYFALYIKRLKYFPLCYEKYHGLKMKEELWN